MNRRSLLKFLGLAPLAAVVPAVAATPTAKGAIWYSREVSWKATPQEFIVTRRSQLADFRRWAELHGITLDVDVAKVDQHGRQPPHALP